MPADPYGAAAHRAVAPAASVRAGTAPGAPDRHRADARTAAAVRDAERLVQVQMRDVGAELARPGEADQRVQVRAVDVDLAAGLVHQRADLADRLLVHAVRRRVGDHERGDRALVCGQLGTQVAEVDRAVGAALDHRRPASASTALAAFVPCADSGIRQTVRSG